MNWFKSLTRDSFMLSSCYYLITNALAATQIPLSILSTNNGTTHCGMSVEDSVSYIERVFAHYKCHGKIKTFHGRVAEVGPGDSCGVGLLFLADGCEQVDLVDRFYAKRQFSHMAEIHRALVQSQPSLRARIIGEDLGNDSAFAGLRRYYGPAAAAEVFFEGHGSYDFIVSCAVLEHTYDPERALNGMADALNPGGVLLHQVDLRDHGMFSPGFHDLKFLEIPDPLYRWMSSATGRPNRVTIDHYRRALLLKKLRVRLLITNLVGGVELNSPLPYEDIAPELRAQALCCVRKCKGKLAAKFAPCSDEDLSVSGFFLVAQKPIA